MKNFIFCAVCFIIIHPGSSECILDIFFREAKAGDSVLGSKFQTTHSKRQEAILTRPTLISFVYTLLKKKILNCLTIFLRF